MRILKIIHGYPPRYNAGSEVYSRTLCAGLSRRHEVHVFTREENPFVADGVVREEHDLLSPEVKLHIVNAAQVGINYQSRRIIALLPKWRVMSSPMSHISGILTIFHWVSWMSWRHWIFPLYLHCMIFG